MLGGFLYKGVENFVEGKSTYGNAKMAVTILLTILIYILLIVVVGKFLWNNVLVSAVTIVRPLTSIWQLLGLVLLFHILLPNAITIGNGDNDMQNSMPPMMLPKNMQRKA